MNRQLFMRDLARFLSDLPAEEREQALMYYEDYFEDAGAENEQKVIEELGSPVDVAKQIKSVNRDQISYGEGSARKNIAAPKVVPKEGAGAENTGNENFQNNTYGYQENFSGNPYGNQENFSGNKYGYPGDSQEKSWTQSPGKVALVIILAVLAIPVGLPLICAIFGCAVALIACLFSLFVSLFATGGALVISGGAGIVCTVLAAVSGHYASSILVLGFSLLLFSVGLFLLWLGVLFCGKGIPAVWKTAGYFCRGMGKALKHLFS